MRCFLAIELPATVHDRLASLQSAFDPLGRAVRWTRPDQIHLTMRFLGEVADQTLAAVCEAATTTAAGFAPFDLEVRGAGCFPPAGAARIVWVGMPDPPPALLDCQQACEDAYARLGFKPEGRPFSPHLTIGRVRDAPASQRVRAAVVEQASFSAGRFRADELVLFQSVLRPSGPTYTIISRAPLLA